jgi:small subunit ribosomal protein S13
MSTEEESQEAHDDLRYFVRIGKTDLDALQSAERALTGMDGIGRRTARTIADRVGVDRHETFGRLDDDTIDAIVDTVEALGDEVPPWLTNRPKDYFTGETRHIIGSDLSLTRQQDINRMQKIGSYKGIRHRRGQKVRGQRTKSTGRTEGTVGVNVERIREEEAEEESE